MPNRRQFIKQLGAGAGFLGGIELSGASVRTMAQTTSSLDSGPFREKSHEVDFCIVGGGIAGLCAAVSAARQGIKVLLMQERPVLGGNSSSEIRVHVIGADRHNEIPHMRETGILEELRLENLYRNRNKNFSIWDTILYETVRYQEHLTVLLNCTCFDATVDQDRISTVTGWQMTTQTFHTISAKLFADCSGDGILAPLTGALSRMGREGRDEYDESIGPETADDKTMGMTLLFQTREYDTPQPFIAPNWAYTYKDCKPFPGGKQYSHSFWEMGYWWVELGGEDHSIHDTEQLRDELLKIAYGTWDHIKNHCPQKKKAENWALEWIQFLPGKRESRRYVGEVVLTQRDIEAGGDFYDVVAYGGWPMDDHHPAGFNAWKIGAPRTIFHPAPSPYGIPLRSLISKNIKNLLFAGRNASCTHAAMSSTRVQGTTSTMGQAIGITAAFAVRQNKWPKEMLLKVQSVQQMLLYNDCYLPGVKQILPDLTLQAELKASQGNPEPVRDGWNRQIGEDSHAWVAYKGDSLEYHFQTPSRVREITLLMDSAMDKKIQLSFHQKDDQLTSVPAVMPKEIDLFKLQDGKWQIFYRTSENHQRLLRIPLDESVKAVRFLLRDTWGADESRIYAFYVS